MDTIQGDGGGGGGVCVCVWRVERSREDKRTRGLADYLNANTMLYRGALFPSRLFYNSICDPPTPGGGGGGRLSRVQATLVRSL